MEPFTPQILAQPRLDSQTPVPPPYDGSAGSMRMKENEQLRKVKLSVTYETCKVLTTTVRAPPFGIHTYPRVGVTLVVHSVLS